MEKNPFTTINEKLEAINQRFEAQPSGPVNEWMNVDQAADYLHVSKSWIYKRSMDGKIPFHKPSKKLMFRRSELDAFICMKPENDLPGVMIER